MICPVSASVAIWSFLQDRRPWRRASRPATRRDRRASARCCRPAGAPARCPPRSRHRQCLGAAAHGGMVRRREIETEQPKDGSDQSFGLAQRQAEDRPQRQRRRDRQGRVARLAAAACCGARPLHAAIAASVNQTVRLPRWRKAGVIRGPIRHSVPLLRDVTAILVRFEWHGDSGVREGPALLHRPPLPPNDRSVQQTHPPHIGFLKTSLKSLTRAEGAPSRLPIRIPSTASSSAPREKWPYNPPKPSSATGQWREP